MNVMRVRTFTTNYLLPTLPALLLVGAAGVAKAAATRHNTSVNVQTQTDAKNHHDSKPQVSVDGHKLTVPTNGETTLNQGGTTTTVKHQQGDENTGTPDVTSTSTSSTGDAVSISVTSQSSGQNTSRSHIRDYSNSGEKSTVYSSVNIITRGRGTIDAN